MLPPYSMIIIQNPPCLPALIAAYMMSIFNGSTIIIDWHNLGYAMFAQRLGSDHLLVKLARYLEKVICRLAHKHICVSEAMKDWLLRHPEYPKTVQEFVTARVLPKLPTPPPGKVFAIDRTRGVVVLVDK